MRPLVNIVTPTIVGREWELWDRCVFSVLTQDYDGPIEHIIVSDRNPGLWDKGVDSRSFRLSVPHRSIRVVEINESWRSPINEKSIGSFPWFFGSTMAMGEFVGFLGDDDEFLPDHVTRHVDAMEAHGAQWTVSQVEFRADGVPQFLVGNDSFALGHLDSDGIMCRASALAVASWSASEHDSAACDWRLVRDWRNASLPGLFIGDGPTAIHHDGWVVGKTGRPDRPQ